MRLLIWFTMSVMLFPSLLVGCILPAQAVEKYAYPNPYRLDNGGFLRSPQTVSVMQATKETKIPQEFDGIVVIVSWSTLCPAVDYCDSMFIRSIIDYWNVQGKKVVLAVATISYPNIINGRKQHATPDWVLSRVKTYKAPVMTLSDREFTLEDEILPDFMDPVFLIEIQKLCDFLAQFDGTPGLSRVRISTGAMAEDNPFIGPLNRILPGFSEREWLIFCTKVSQIYWTSFRTTGTEFDLGRLSWVWARGSEEDRRAIKSFMNDLLEHGTFLSFNGLGSNSLAQILRYDSSDGVSVSLEFIQNYKKRGGSTGLEMVQPFYQQLTSDIEKIFAALQIVRPDRVVFFSDVLSDILSKKIDINRRLDALH